MHRLAKASAVLGVALAAAAGISFSAARQQTPATTDASSHREAPGISNDPTADTTDFYMWVSPDAPNSVTFVQNTWPLANPTGGPNWFLFGDDVNYAINIDNNGDAKADIVYEFRFRTEFGNSEQFLYNLGPVTSLNDPDLNIRQFYTVDRLSVDVGERVRIATDVQIAPHYVGVRSFPDYGAVAQQAVQDLPGGSRVFAGQRDDPFFVDIGSLFDLLAIRGGPPGNTSQGSDILARYTVNSIALQVPKSDLIRSDSPIIGAWTTTSRLAAPLSQTIEPQWKQVSRLGNPLVNEVVIPLKLKDAFNSIDPTKDAAALPYVLDPIVPKLLKGIYGVDSPPAPRQDLVTIFLTGIPGVNQPPNVVPSEMLRLNTSTPPSANPNRMGVLGGDSAGFPNGRRPIDDVTDIALQAMAGATPLTPEFNRAPNNQLGDAVPANDKPFMTNFPYLAMPEPGSDTYGVRPAVNPVPPLAPAGN